MAEFSDTRGIVTQNLIDAGCGGAFAEECTELILGGKTNSALNALGEYREKLLGEIHANQKRIDCLDHLIYMLGKSDTNPSLKS